MPSGALQRGQQLTGGIPTAAGTIIERPRCPEPMTALIRTACQLCRVYVCAVMHTVRHARPTAERRSRRRTSEETTTVPGREGGRDRSDRTRRGVR